MQDREPTYPGRVTLTPVYGLANTYDMERADRPLQEGTPLNKANLLKDATAALYGLGTDAVPDDALHLLSRFQSGLGNEYLWKKINVAAGYYEIQTLKDSIYIIESETKLYTFKYSDSITIDEVGNLSLTNPLTFTATYSQFRSDYGTTLLGKYLDTTGLAHAVGIIFIPTNATINYYNGRQVEIKNSYVISVGYDENRAFVGYVNSPSPDAYPPAVSDGNTYTLLGQLGDKVRIATGSYTGTGTYGESNPNNLTFEFEPKLVFMFEGKFPATRNVSSQKSHPVYGTTIGMTTTYSKSLFNIYSMRSGDDYYLYAKKSSDGKTLSWYHGASARAQMNDSEVTYRYIAIG